MGAYNAQGCKLRRGTTEATASTNVSHTAICVDSTARIIRTTNAAVNFLTGGFTTSMRVWLSGSTLNTGIFTVSCVTATAIGIHELCTAMTSANSSSITVYGQSFAEIGQVRDFSVQSQGGVIDVTHLGSTAKEFLPNLSQEGPVDFSVFLMPTSLTAAEATYQHANLKNDRAARQLRPFHLMLTDNTAAISSACYPSNCQFDAYVTNFGISGAVDQALTANISLQVTSAIHWNSKTS